MIAAISASLTSISKGSRYISRSDALVDLDVGAEALVLLVVDRVVLAHRDDVMGLDRLRDLHPHDPGQVGVLGEVLEVAPGDLGAVQADAGPFEHVLAQGCGLRADQVAVLVGQLGVEPGGQRDRHGQRRRRRAGRAVAHADAHRPVGDPEARDAQLVDGGHVALDPDLGGEAVHLLLGGGLRDQGVDVDRLHVAVELLDLLLQGHGGDEQLGPLPGRKGGVRPGLCCRVRHRCASRSRGRTSRRASGGPALDRFGSCGGGQSRPARTASTIAATMASRGILLVFITRS